MASRAAEVELTFLKKIGSFDEWWFQAKPHPQFDAFFEHLALDRQQYKVRKIHFTQASGYIHVGEAWQVDEKMLWVISHFFSNWDEMYGKTKAGWEQQWQKKTEQGEPEQKKCSVCGRYATHSPTVHCSDCQIEICRSCLYAHRKQHEAEKCSGCNGNPAGPFVRCVDCGKDLCEACMEIHRTRHEETERSTGNYCVNCGKPKNWGGRFTTCPSCHAPVCFACESVHAYNHTKSQARCFTCGNRTTTECDECRKPYCFPCFAKHRGIHEQKHTCMWCSNVAPDPCPVCGFYYCDAHKADHTKAHSPYNYSTRQEYGRINLDDFNIDSSWVDEMLKNTQEFAERQAKATEERMRQEQQARAEREKASQENFDEWLKKTFEGAGQHSYSYSSQQSNGRTYTHTYTPSGVSQELTAAFTLMGISTRATVQEVKRAFKRMAKQGEHRHPDVGGTEKQFIKLNNAYELALAHAQRNER